MKTYDKDTFYNFFMDSMDREMRNVYTMAKLWAWKRWQLFEREDKLTNMDYKSNRNAFQAIQCELADTRAAINSVWCMYPVHHPVAIKTLDNFRQKTSLNMSRRDIVMMYKDSVNKLKNY